MDLKREYMKLYQHWLTEFEQIHLTSLNQIDYDNYRKLLAHINSFQVDKSDNIKFQLIEIYKMNLKFLFNDLLKIRENKIINATLENQEIDLGAIVESEKLLYQNLISTFKGYKKVKNLSLSEDQLLEQEILDEMLEVDTLDEEFNLEETEETKPMEIVTKKEKIKEKDISYNYTLIRFLKKAEAIVGIDLINYGPFEKNDIANLPDKNALIFINEKVAEKIDVS